MALMKYYIYPPSTLTMMALGQDPRIGPNHCIKYKFLLSV